MMKNDRVLAVCLTALISFSCFVVAAQKKKDLFDRDAFFEKWGNELKEKGRLQDLRQEKEYPLHYAVEKKNVDEVKELLGGCLRKFINVADFADRYPIHYAADLNNFEMVKLLVANGAEADPFSEKQPWSPLSLSVQRQNVAMAQFLIDHGADVNAAHPTLVGGTVKMIFGQSPLGEAFFGVPESEIRTDIIRLLIDNGADPNQPGNTFLHKASLDNAIEDARILLDAGANVNALDWEGRTPLYQAVKGEIFFHDSRVKMVELLLSRGADPFMADKIKCRPYDLAQKNRRKEIMQILRDKMSKINPEFFSDSSTLL